jgi:phage host-nuclease inhibitor protein Gam
MITPPNDQEGTTTESTVPAGRESALQNIKTIREILVGDQIHNLNERFHNLEKSLEAHYSKLVNQLMAKFEAVQTLSKSEVDDLGKTLTEKINQLQKEDAALAEELKISMKRLGDLERRTEDMKSALSEQVRKMYEEFSKQMSEFSRLVKTQHDDMARQMISRKDFANMMGGLASNVSGDPDHKKSA